jgi:thiamine biosynthesis lipoprotein
VNEFSVTRQLFGKEIEIAVRDLDGALVSGIIDDTYNEGMRLSRIFSVFDESSELSLLNKNRKASVSRELMYVISKSLGFSKMTRGEYDIGLGKLIQKRKNMEKEPELHCSYNDIDLRKNVIILKNENVMLDLGSIAKGYIADKMVECLKRQGVLAGLIDARGDIRVFGQHSQVIGIQHPRDRKSLIAQFNLRNSAVATSGDYNQCYGTFEKCHILNKKDAISVTVVAPSLMVADGFATALFVSAKKDRERILAENRAIKTMVIDEDLNLEYHNGFETLVNGR